MLLLVLPGIGHASELENRLNSKDPATRLAAAKDLIREGDQADPYALMSAAYHVFESGDKKRGLYWFYAGQLRSRYWPKLRGENAQLISIAIMTYGVAINNYGMRDVTTMVGTIKDVLAWDEKTFETWLVANQLANKRTDIEPKRQTAREGLAALSAQLASNRGQYEKLAREYKSPEQLHREAILATEKEVREHYSTAPVTCVAGGKRLKIPANYIAVSGPQAQSTCEMIALGSSLHLTFFLPEVKGFTRDNWRVIVDATYSSGKKDGKVMYVHVNRDADLRSRPDEKIEAFLIAKRPQSSQLSGHEAHVFDYHLGKDADLPIANMGHSETYYILASGTPAQGRSYLTCKRPDPEFIVIPEGRGPISGCELYIYDRPRDLRLYANFPAKSLPAWRNIDARLRALFAAWSDGVMPPEELRALRMRAIDTTVKQFSADYSTEPVTCVLGGKRLKIPANFIAMSAQSAQRQCETSGIPGGALTVHISLPEMSGFTPEMHRKTLEDTYLAGKTNEHALRMARVEVNREVDLRRKPEAMIEAFLATRPTSSEIFGQKAYVFDPVRHKRDQLPISSWSAGATYYVLKGSALDPSYLICGKLNSAVAATSTDGWAFGGCELFAYDRLREMHLYASFHPSNGPSWREIDARLRALFSSWLEAAGRDQVSSNIRQQ